jgi:hypothetical protein
VNVRAGFGSRRFRKLWSVLALAASITKTQANPISIMPGLELSGENVTVNVYRTESRIEGAYSFHSLAPPAEAARDRSPMDYSVYVAFPVILPTNGVSEANLIGIAKPVGTLDGRKVGWTLSTADWSEGWLDTYRMTHRPYSEAVDGLPQGPKVAEGWAAVFFETHERSDRPGVDRKMHISYTQPHLPGAVSAYLPILPAEIGKTNYLITFKAQKGVHFTPIGTYQAVGEASDNVLSVRPANLQLLQVRVK